MKYLNCNITDMSLDQVILDTLVEQKEIDSLSFASEHGLDHQKLVGAIKSLLALPTEYIKVSMNRIYGLFNYIWYANYLKL